MMRFLGRLFFKDLSIKISAVILAVFTFFYIQREDIREKTVKDAKIRVVDLKPGWRVVHMSREKIDLPILGPRQKIELRNNRNVFVELSCADIEYPEEEGYFVKNFLITEDVVRGLSYDVSLNFPRREVPSVRVKAARYATKKLTVKVEVRGKPAPGYRVKWQTLSPTMVDVTGPDYVLKYEETIPTEPISIEGRKDVIDVDVGLNTDYLKETKGVSFECRSKVHVNIGIKSLPGEKKLSGVPVRILKSQEKVWRVRTTPSVVDVTVIGEVEELKQLKKSFVKAYIDADDLPGPGKGIKMGVKFFIDGPWKTLHIKENVTVTTEVLLLPK